MKHSITYWLPMILTTLAITAHSRIELDRAQITTPVIKSPEVVYIVRDDTTRRETILRISKFYEGAAIQVATR